jgi:preprotein translocase subunit SecF
MTAKNKIDFVGKIKICMILSSALILVGIVSIIAQGGLKYNIEFNGGYLMHAGFFKQVAITEIRNAFSGTDLTGIEIQEFGDTGGEAGAFGTEVILKLKTMDRDVKELEKDVTDVLSSKFGSDSYEVRQSSSIGPKVGEELKTSAVKAVIWAIIFILIYITVKFKFKYGVAAVAALFHDVLITIGLLSIIGSFTSVEISLSVIAAVLTLVGYSLNDTIVVFDRIRENVKKYEGMDYDKMINVSINETLSRTILTGLTTLFVVFILFLFGGDVIRDLSLTLLIGIVVGTYSSVYVASPLLILWENATKKKRVPAKA